MLPWDSLSNLHMTSLPLATPEVGGNVLSDLYKKATTQALVKWMLLFRKPANPTVASDTESSEHRHTELVHNWEV